MELSKDMTQVTADAVPLQFPVLDEIPAIKLPEDKPKPKLVKKGPSMAKRRFNQMAFSVLAQIVDEKTKGAEDEDEVDGETNEDKKDENANESDKENKDKNEEIKGSTESLAPRKQSSGNKSLSRHSSTASLTTSDGNPKTTPRKKGKRGPSFMSVLRLASYRRKAGGKGFLGRKTGSTSVSSSLADLDEDDENIKELPSEPRFCATLSTEAQYAMLKCYEDVLVENIQSTKPKEPIPEDAILFRVRTPKEGHLQSLRLSGSGNIAVGPRDSYLSLPPIPTGIEEDVVDGDKVSKPSSSRGSESKMSMVRLPTISYSNTRRPESNASSLTSFAPGSLPVVPKEKQLRLSYRFQTAMDILDAINKEKKGYIITSPRAQKIETINPWRNYNQWSKGWSKEFQYELRSGNVGGN